MKTRNWLGQFGGKIMLSLFLCSLAGKVCAWDPLSPGSHEYLNAWSFSNTNNWFSDLGYAPLSFTNVIPSGIGDGNAAFLDSTNAAWLKYRIVETNAANTNLTVDQGTVMMFFAPNWSGTN